MRLFSSSVLALALTAVGLSASAQPPYPTRPITVVVPFAAGGPTDVMTRILGQHVSQTLGQQIGIENVPGGAGSIGAPRVAKPPPPPSTRPIAHPAPHPPPTPLHHTLSH